jgi:hypothetical protein
VVVLLVLVGAGAALWMTGVFGGGGSGESESSFAGDVNGNVLGPLQRADAVAAEHARRSVGGALLVADGVAIVDAADRATVYLRGLSRLSTQQRLETQMLLAFVGANRAYGNALARFSPSSGSSLIAVEGAARAARSTLAIVNGRLSPEFGLPLAGVFVTPRAAPPPPPQPPPPPPPPPPATTEVVPTTTTAASGSAQVVRTYMASLETMLEGLSRGRARLKTALGGALGCTLAYRTAANEVLGVVDNRAVIWNQLNGTHPPTAQTAALKATLLSALEHSIAADRHYRDWLQRVASAHAGCPPPPSGADYRAAGQDDVQASSLKKRFAAGFNPLARRLGLRSWAATDF